MRRYLHRFPVDDPDVTIDVHHVSGVSILLGKSLSVHLATVRPSISAPRSGYCKGSESFAVWHGGWG
jgi:hypothetical protein